MVSGTVDQRGHCDAEAGHGDVAIQCLQQDLLVNQGVLDDVMHRIPWKVDVTCMSINNDNK